MFSGGGGGGGPINLTYPKKSKLSPHAMNSIFVKVLTEIVLVFTSSETFHLRILIIPLILAEQSI